MKKITEIWLKHDPRSKLLLALLFSISTIMLDSIISLVGLLILSLSFCRLAQVNIIYLCKRCLAVNAFLLFVWLLLPWQIAYHGNQWSLSFNPTALWLALAISLKCNAIFLAWMGLLWQTSLSNILRALATWRISPKLLTLFFLFCRFTWTIKEEYATLRLAMRARGFHPKFNRHTLRSFAHLITSMLVSGFERGQRVYSAMLCRGFNGKFHFAAYELRWRTRDGFVLAAVLTGIVLVCLPEIIGY